MRSPVPQEAIKPVLLWDHETDYCHQSPRVLDQIEESGDNTLAEPTGKSASTRDESRPDSSLLNRLLYQHGVVLGPSP